MTNMKTRQQYRLEYAKKLLDREIFLDRVFSDLRVKSKTLGEKIEKISDTIKDYER